MTQKKSNHDKSSNEKNHDSPMDENSKKHDSKSKNDDVKIDNSNSSAISKDEDIDVSKSNRKVDEPKVDNLDEEYNKLKEDLDQVSDKLIRAQAELINMQRRNEKDQANIIKYDGQKLAGAILPIKDNLERALNSGTSDDDQLKKGVGMVIDQLATVLKDHEITEIGEEGEKFDPTKHQAIKTVESDSEHGPDEIIEVMQKGYKFKDRVLRPAMVVVSQ